MNDASLRQNLVEQFRAYLEEEGSPQSTEEAVAGESEFSVVAELAGLKSEVKRESRQVKEALEQFKATLGTLQSGYDILIKEFEQRQANEKDLRREVLRPLLLQLLELHDRLEAGVNVILTPPRSFLARFCRDQLQLIESLRQGQRMTLRRLSQLLTDYHLRPLETLDKPFDPHTMRVIEVESRADVAPGIVTAELRKGFFWGEELLRAAEVKVNKREGV